MFLLSSQFFQQRRFTTSSTYILWTGVKVQMLSIDVKEKTEKMEISMFEVGPVDTIDIHVYSKLVLLCIWTICYWRILQVPVELLFEWLVTLISQVVSIFINSYKYTQYYFSRMWCLYPDVTKWEVVNTFDVLLPKLTSNLLKNWS